MLVSKVILEFTVYVLMVFVSMILHELSHLIAARLLGEKGKIKVLYKKHLLFGLRLELEKYKNVSSFKKLKRGDKVRYTIIALAPYWLIVLGLWLTHFSSSIACIYAGYVIAIFNIINLPLEFIDF